MAGKSYKQLYEELKAQLEAQPQSTPITEEEIFALKAVAYGCNTNRKLQSINGSAKFLERETNKAVSFEEALVTVYRLIERLSNG
jgi:ribosomal protein S8E